MLNLNKETESKKEVPHMDDKEAFALIRQWADDMEVRLRGKDFEDLQNEIWLAVKKERLVFDRVKETFTYVLRNPVVDKNNESKTLMSMLIISECTIEQKKGLVTSKDIEALEEMIKVYCKDTEGGDIPLGYISRIKDRDLAIISAVILGFFVQVVPGRQ